ncbi:MAG: thioredoxin family protein [Fimbriimonadaceae bacterium]|nr:thioredoxin family protein [Fimbriimonadaceae bacterium]
MLFIGLGLGLAAPFSLAFFNPSLVQLILPKPGRWLSVFKKLCAVPMFLTALGLGWVLQQQLFTSTESVYVDQWGQSWEPYSEEVIQEIIAQKQNASVDFTAAWCIICQVNKLNVFGDDAVRALINENKVRLIRADCTHSDPAVNAALLRWGTRSVPTTIFYEQGIPKKMPTGLASSMFIEELIK